MVIGISRQVIVVRSPDPKLFEQAIFILRADALGKDGVSDRAILRQARGAAEDYVHPGRRRRRGGALWALAGSAVTGLCWLLTVLL